MNYLGHAYLTRNCPELMAGNMAGDFYKGKIENFTDLPVNIRNGIRLHRYIDECTDGSETMKKVIRIFHSSGIEKVGPIAGDILLDHYLAGNWTYFSKTEYQAFINFIYTNTESDMDVLSPQFAFMYNRLKRYDWFNYYPTFDGISEILRQFSKRLSFENNLDQCSEVYRLRSDEINMHFSAFLAEVTEKTNNFIIENLK